MCSVNSLFRFSFLLFCKVFVFIQFYCSPAQAQDLRFKYLTINDGLSQNTVNSIVQDKRGVIWIGTWDGLSKFNGYEFSTYNHNARDKNSLSNNRINTLLYDRAGNLWVGTYDGLNLFDRRTETFKVFRNAKGGRYIVHSIQEDLRGNIWVATNQGVMFLDRKSGSIVNVNMDLGVPSSPESLIVQYLYIDLDQRMWVGFRAGVRLFDIKTQKLQPLPALFSTYLSNVWLRAVKQAENGDLWFATEASGLFHYQKEGNRFSRYTTQNGLLNNAVRDLLFVDQKVWIATLTGLNILDLKTQKISNYTYSPEFESGKSISHASVRCLFKDKTQNVWLGTYSGGINLVYNYKENFNHKGQQSGDKNKLSGKEVNSILEDRPNSLWLATDAGGLNHWDRTTGAVKVYKHKRVSESLYTRVKKVGEHENPDKLWLSTDRGVFVFSKSTGAFEEFKSVKDIKTNVRHQNHYFERTAEGLWLGTNYNGLYFLSKQGRVTSYVNRQGDRNSIASNVISCLQADGNKGLWMGHQSNGLNYIDFRSGKIRHFKFEFDNPKSLSSNHVSSLLLDSKNRLWVGTEGGGLNYFDRRSEDFFSINQEGGLSKNHTIHSIEEDNRGGIWVSTNKGLFQISIRKSDSPVRNNHLKITHYTAKDGLQSDQFIRGASFKSNTGELFFGGINGLSSFFPGNISVNKNKPYVVFTDLLILNKPVEPSATSFLKQPLDFTNEIELEHDQAYLTIRFAALNYIYPEKNNYAYKLEGFADSSWNYVGNQRSATYTNLDPGTYIFKVKASNNSNIWNELPRELRIIVLPPWWRTWWAYLIYASIVLSLLYFFSYYVRYTERLKNTIEHEAYLYRKEQELAQKKLSFFINISHEIKTPITMILTPLQRLMGLPELSPKMFNYLSLMNRSGQRLLTLIDQLLDFRKLDTETNNLKAAEGNLVRFTKEIVIVFSELAKTKNIDLSFHSDSSELQLWFDRDKLEKMLYNIISNAIKYTPSYGKVEVTVDSENSEWAVISVKDNGCGISSSQMKHLFEPFHHYDSMQNNVQGTGVGLAFTKELVEQHHGKIEVDSRSAENDEAGYTHIKLKIPLANDYLTYDDVDEQHLKPEDIGSYKNFNLNKKTQLQTKKKAVKKLNENKAFLMLIVEDNEDVLNFLAESFEQDFEVIKAINGRAGYEKALEVIPDVIISDVMMPEMNGIELCSSLKTDIRTNHIPLILLTARSPLIFKIEGLENGADEYVTKPFNFDLLELKVWNLLDSRQKMRLRYQKEVLLQPTNTVISSFDDKFLEKVIKYIEDHINEEQLSVEELSSEIGMTRGNLYKKLKSLTNQSPIEFIRYIRIKRASQLLIQHRIYVNEVAFMVGFQDVNYFRKCFKEQFGVTPSEFAKEVKSV